MSAVSTIPKIFWYCVSFCMVAITLCLCATAYRSQSINIEVASFKISSAVSDVQLLIKQLHDKEMELANYKQKLDEAAAKLSTESRTHINIPEIKLDPTPKNDAIDKLQSVQQSLPKN